MFTCSKVIRGPTRFGKAQNLIFLKLSSQNVRGFDHSTILSPSFHSLSKERLTQLPPFVYKIRRKTLRSLPEKLGGGVPHPSWNPYPVWENNLWFFATLFQTSSKNWYPISDLKPWSPARDRNAWQTDEQSLFFLGPSSKTPDTSKWPRAWLKAREVRVSRLCRSTLARVCTPLTKSQKKRGCSQSN